MFCGAVLANPVESSNIVGYSGLPVTQGQFYMVGVQFENATTGAANTFNSLLKMQGISACSYDDMYTEGAEIQILVDGAYKKYYFINDAYDSNENAVDADVWADEDGYVITDADALELGNGFWFRALKCESGAMLNAAGQVSADSSVTLSFPGGKSFAIIAPPFPKAVSLGDVTTTGASAVAYDEMYDSGAEIQVYVNGGYNKYYYINDAYDSSENEVNGDVWADEDGYLVEDDMIQVGTSIWIRSPNAGTITFNL